MRFFFDYTTKDQSLLDYRGQEFHNSTGAIEFAEEIVENLKCSLSTNWLGWQIEVRDTEGKKFLSLPIEQFVDSIGIGSPHDCLATAAL
jgi:hypothetical protein